MRNLRKNHGFTLMELLLSIAVGALVTVAATTVLLLGLRMGSRSRQTVTQQNTARIVMTMLENLASDSSLKMVITGTDEWYICSTAHKISNEEPTAENSVIVAFTVDESGKGSVYTGGKVVTTKDGAGTKAHEYSDGTPILKEVFRSFATLSEENLLSVSVETEEGTYASSVYCPLAPEREAENVEDEVLDPDSDDPIEELVPEEDVDNGTDIARKAFLKILHSQLESPGVILEKVRVTNGQDTKLLYLSRGEYYAKWYDPSWPEDTAWCACFIIWGLDDDRWDLYGWTDDEKAAELAKWDLLGTELTREENSLAHVDGLIHYLSNGYREECENSRQETNEPAEQGEEPATPGITPGYYASELVWGDGYCVSVQHQDYRIQSGDLIFFDWLADGVQDGDHVGVVLTVLDGYVYTIEGNTADMVAVRKYRINDPRIMGYGVLDWKTNTEMRAQGAE